VFEAAPEEPAPTPEPSGLHQLGRRHLSDRQAEVVERLLEASADEARERPYGAISVRTIAKRAGVAPATAYTYFSSKDHLLAEVLWQRVQASPFQVDPDRSLADRVMAAVASMGFQSLDAPAINACTTALLADGPDVKAVRDRIGREVARRLQAALGAEADRAALRVLQITYTGAILSAGLGHLPFDEVPGLLSDAAALLTSGAA
jgi:AcrR family transcriptional regulator